MGIAIYDAKKQGLLRSREILKNILPGIVVGIVALPLAMAFAIASGVKPENGLYTAIIAGFCVSLFGGTRLQIAGPTGAFIVILSSITQKYGIDGLQIATLMAGFILIFMGVTHLGSIIKYIPEPVIIGFTSGIGIVIWVGQWKDFFGLNVSCTDGHFHQKLLTLIQALPHFHTATTGIALLSLAIILLSKKYLQRLPGALAALIIGTLVQWLGNFDGVATIGSAFGGIPQTLPSFHLPTCNFQRFIELIEPAFTIALLGAIESLLSAVVADSMSGTHHCSNQELIGQGIANVLSPLWGGFAATGAIARTATNIRSGGTSPVAGIVHAFTLIFLILVLAPLASHIPLATLSAVLFIVAYNMSDVPRFVGVLKYAPKSDIIVLWLTFFLTVFGDLVVAVNVGVIVATLSFMRRMAKTVQVELNNNEALEHQHQPLPNDVSVYSIEGPFFFGAISTFQSVLNQVNPAIHTIIIRLKHVPFIDVTGLDSLHTAIQSLHKRNIRVIFCEANPQVNERMSKTHLQDLCLDKHFTKSLDQAIDACSA